MTPSTPEPCGPILRLQLLGGYRILTPAGADIAIAARKARALLAYLAMRPGEPCPRERLAALLWEESGERQARHSLRQALTGLRGALPVAARAVLVTEGELVRVPAGAVEVDALVLERLAAADHREALERAVALCEGELMAGFEARARGFEDWLMVERTRLRERALEVMGRLLATYQVEGAAERAIPLAIRMLALDPLREPVHRALMALYARQGRYGAALRQHCLCREALHRELGIGPEPETDRLFHTIVEQRRSGAGRGGEAPASPPPVVPAEPEPRRAAILALRLAGPGHAARGAGAEEAHIAAWQARVRDTVLALGGTLIESAGATATAAFGHPAAHGNDAERALRAALALLGTGMGGAGPVGPVPQAGLASGTVVARGGLTGEPVTGAQRLAERAEAGELLVSEAVRLGLGARLDAEPADPLGEAPEAGGAWRVLDLRSAPAVAYFVGRKAELRQFAAALDACLAGEGGHSFLIRGEAGIGKSALLARCAARAAERGLRVHKALVLDFGTGPGPIQSLVRSLLDLPAGAAPGGVQAAAEAAVHDDRLDAAQAVFLNDLLDLPQPAELAAMYEAMDERAREAGRQQVVADLVRAAGACQPLVLAVEDIHWAGAATLGQLARLAAIMPHCQALLAMTARPDEGPPDPAWRSGIYGAPLTTLDLGPLRESEAEALAEHCEGTVEHAGFVRGCIERAAGNPLYLEQLLRTGPRAGGLPDSIQGLVLARLDALPAADRRAAQAASVLGQRFDAATLRRLIDAPDYGCEALVQHLLVRPEEDGHLFVHALIHAGVYASLPDLRRRELHLRAAAAYRGRDPEAYALHLDRAGDGAAPGAYLEAARGQAEAYRNEPAARLAERGLALATGPAERVELLCLLGELRRASGAVDPAIEAFQEAVSLGGEAPGACPALIGLAAALGIEDRYGEALEALDRAQALARRHRLETDLARIHHRRGNVLFPMGRLDECLHEHELARELAVRVASPPDEARALSGLGDAEYLRGRMGSAYRHFDRCLRLARVHGFGRIEVANRAMRAATLLYLNRLRPALEDCRRAEAMAQRVFDRRGELLALSVHGLILTYRGDWAGKEACSERALGLARRIGSRRFEAESLGELGHARASLGRPDEAAELIDQAWELAQACGVSYYGPAILGFMAAVNPRRRRWALGEGERLLAEGCVSHNHLLYYQLAIELAIDAGAWEEVERLAAALQGYTAAEPLAWSDFYCARGRTLAAAGRGERVEGELARLRTEAERAGLGGALPALDLALGPR